MRINGLWIIFILSVGYGSVTLGQPGVANSNYWSATDALGRKLIGAQEAGNVKQDKFVGIFYLTWHTDFMADFSPVLNIREILEIYPDAARQVFRCGEKQPGVELGQGQPG